MSVLTSLQSLLTERPSGNTGCEGTMRHGAIQHDTIGVRADHLSQVHTTNDSGDMTCRNER